ncbi:MAG: hypothetical protein AAGC55_32960, partial [Myxococcota bacterium]
MLRCCWAACAILLAVAVTGGTVWAEEPRAATDIAPRIGLVIAASVNIDRDEAIEMTRHIGRAVEEELLVEIVIGADSARPGLDTVSEACIVDRECAGKLATQLDVQQLLFLSLVRLGGEVRINFTWFDGQSGAVAIREPLVVARGVDPVDGLSKLAIRELLPGARLRPVETAQPPDEDPPDEGPGTDLAAPPVEPAPSRGGRRATTGVYIAGAISLLALGVAGGAALYTGVECDWKVSPCENLTEEQVDSRANLVDIPLLIGAASGVTAIVL